MSKKKSTIRLPGGRVFIPFRLGKNGKVSGGFVERRKK